MNWAAQRVLLGLCLIAIVGGTTSRASAMLNGEPVLQQEGVEQAIAGLQLLDQFDAIISPCAGVILRADAILTSGHCIDTALNKTLVGIRVTRTTDLSFVRKNDPEAREVRRVYPHPRYKPQPYYQDGKPISTTYENDLAVIFLNAPLSGSIPAIRFPSTVEALTAGTPLVVYGYGMSEDSKKFGEAGYRGRYSRTLQRAFFVLGSEQYFGNFLTVKDAPTSVCYGDSGGPGFLMDTNRRPLPVVATITSATTGRRVLVKGQWVKQCRGQAILQPIAPHAAWIESVLAREPVRP